ncbi:MAG: serine hydrolase domain-containing protein [Thermaurantiacus sp.]
MIRALGTFVVALALAGAAAAGKGAPSASPPPQETAARLQAAIGLADATPAVVIAFRSAGSDWRFASGLRHADGPPARPDDPFRIASITKSFVAAAAHRLAEQGKLNLSQPVGPLLSAETRATLEAGGYRTDQIRVIDLMTHQSGLRDYATSRAYLSRVAANPLRQWTAAEQIAIAMGLGRPWFPAGQRTRYSDTGYAVLGEIIARATALPLGEAVPVLLDFERLGLRETRWEQPAAGGGSGLPANAIHAFQGSEDTAAMDPSFDLFGGGGLISSAPDLLTAMAAMVSGTLFQNAETAAEMRRPVQPADRGGYVRTAGFEELVYGDAVCFGHKGHWGTLAVWCPDRNAGFVFSVNGASRRAYARAARLHRILAEALLSEYLTLP